jgi:hypothetical protein
MKKDKTVNAYPSVGMLSQIKIKDKEETISIGGFTADGGFLLRSPYDLIKQETKNLGGEDITYYSFIKSSNKMCEHEKELRKMEKDREDYEKKRKKELEEELNRLKKK